MIISKVSRTYSRSINVKNYGLPESWIKIESTYEAICESGDDATKISTMLYDQAKKDVIDNINAVIEQINQKRTVPAAPAPAAPVVPTAPVAPVAPTAPVAPVAPQYPGSTGAPTAPVAPVNTAPRAL